MSDCTHTRREPGRWASSYIHYNDGEVELIEEWEDGWFASTFADVDLHRYCCTQCEKVFYYSGKAREHFEKGIKFPGIKGLE